MNIDRMDINQVLLEMRSLRSQVKAFQPEAADDIARQGLRSLQPVDKDTPSFSQLLDQAVNKVNDLQQASNTMASDFEQGVSGVDITDVMIASQKASVSFQAMLQVRNKLIESYRDIMNMPV